MCSKYACALSICSCCCLMWFVYAVVFAGVFGWSYQNWQNTVVDDGKLIQSVPYRCEDTIMVTESIDVTNLTIPERESLEAQGHALARSMLNFEWNFVLQANFLVCICRSSIDQYDKYLAGLIHILGVKVGATTTARQEVEAAWCDALNYAGPVCTASFDAAWEFFMNGNNGLAAVAPAWHSSSSTGVQAGAFSIPSLNGATFVQFLKANYPDFAPKTFNGTMFC